MQFTQYLFQFIIELEKYMFFFRKFCPEFKIKDNFVNNKQVKSFEY